MLDIPLTENLINRRTGDLAVVELNQDVPRRVSLKVEATECRHLIPLNIQGQEVYFRCLKLIEQRGQGASPDIKLLWVTPSKNRAAARPVLLAGAIDHRVQVAEAHVDLSPRVVGAHQRTEHDRGVGPREPGLSG